MGAMTFPAAAAEHPDDIRERGRRLDNAAEAYSIPLLPRDELLAYAAWHGELRASG